MPLTFERLHERGCALTRWLAAGGDVDALLDLDRRVRRAKATDWPGRGAGEEPRVGIPDLDFDGLEEARRPGVCPRCGKTMCPATRRDRFPCVAEDAGGRE
jgi:hypothetical protein